MPDAGRTPPTSNTSLPPSCLVKSYSANPLCGERRMIRRSGRTKGALPHGSNTHQTTNTNTHTHTHTHRHTSQTACAPFQAQREDRFANKKEQAVSPGSCCRLCVPRIETVPPVATKTARSHYALCPQPGWRCLVCLWSE